MNIQKQIGNISRRDKIALLTVVFVVVLTFLSFGTERFDYYKVGGISMSPTIKQPFYVPIGAQEVRHRGAYVRIQKRTELSIGSIVLFVADDGGNDIKRIDKIREDGTLWVTADNVGWTGCDSREYGWISKERVVGVVEKIITPSRFLRGLTAKGRWWNELEFAYPPSAIQQVEKGFAVVENYNGKTYLCHPNMAAIMLGDTAKGAKASSRGSRLAVPLQGMVAVVELGSLGIKRFRVVGPVTMASWMSNTEVCVRMTMGKSDPTAFIQVQ